MAPDQQAAVDAILGKGGAAAPAEGPSPDESGEHAIDEESLGEGALDAATDDFLAVIDARGEDRRAAAKGFLRALRDILGS
jgi:hypothetical protein